MLVRIRRYSCRASRTCRARLGPGTTQHIVLAEVILHADSSIHNNVIVDCFLMHRCEPGAALNVRA